jgi:extracellular elastinolytic metalloproteinase
MSLTALQFYNGAIPVPFTNLEVDSIRHPHREYCDFLTAEVETRVNEFSFQGSQGGQVIMGEHSSTKLDELTHVHVSNCRFQNLPDELVFDLTDVMDFRPALLQFMVAATPKDDVVNDILGNFDTHIDKMMVTSTSHFAPHGASVEFLVSQVPDTVNPVKAKMAYIQVPNTEGEMHLRLVWKVRLDLKRRIFIVNNCLV